MYVLKELLKLKELGFKYNHTFTEEQLLNNNLKNIDGESMIEVKTRMDSFMDEIINNYKNKRIAIVSHGASMRFYLINYCKLNKDIKLEYNGNILDFSSPCIIKLTFDNNELKNIENI